MVLPSYHTPCLQRKVEQLVNIRDRIRDNFLPRALSRAESEGSMFRPQLLKTNLALYGSARLGSLLWMALLFLAVSSCALAQVSASISGRIEDPAGAAIPGTTVIVTSVETGAARVARSDEAGNYRVLSLPVGPHEVKAEKTGFQSVIQRGINLVVGQEAVVNLRLAVGEIQQAVTVTAEAPLINTTTASVAGLVGEKEVKDLPLNGRSFDNLIALNAGAINFTQHQPGGPGGAVGNFFSVSF
jgi:hypothetical protein